MTGNRVKISKDTAICDSYALSGCRDFRIAGLAVFSDVAGLTDACEEDIQLQNPTVEALTDGSYGTFTAQTIPTAINQYFSSTDTMRNQIDNEFYVTSM